MLIETKTKTCEKEKGAWTRLSRVLNAEGPAIKSPSQWHAVIKKINIRKFPFNNQP